MTGKKRNDSCGIREWKQINLATMTLTDLQEHLVEWRLATQLLLANGTHLADLQTLLKARFAEEMAAQSWNRIISNDRFKTDGACDLHSTSDGFDVIRKAWHTRSILGIAWSSRLVVANWRIRNHNHIVRSTNEIAWGCKSFHRQVDDRMHCYVSTGNSFNTQIYYLKSWSGTRGWRHFCWFEVIWWSDCISRLSESLWWSSVGAEWRWSAWVVWLT